MKLRSLLTEIDQTEPDLKAVEFFLEFSTQYNCNPLWRKLGKKGDCTIYTAELDASGAMSLVVTDVQLVAKCTEKEAMFGLTYTTAGLEQVQHAICVVKCNKNSKEVIAFDSKDKKNFSASAIKFLDLIDSDKG